MRSKIRRDEAIGIRKAKTTERVKALRKAEPVVSLASTIDRVSLLSPLIFDRVRIPEYDSDAEGEDV